MGGTLLRSTDAREPLGLRIWRTTCAGSPTWKAWLPTSPVHKPAGPPPAMRNAGRIRRPHHRPTDRIRPAGKTHAQGDCRHPSFPLAATLARVDTPVRTGPAHCMGNAAQTPSPVNRGAPRTVREVFDSRYRDHNGFHHSRSEPKPLVVSPAPLCWYLMACHPP